MSDKKTEHKAVFAVTEREDKSFWTRVGVALPNKDGSTNIFLDALPVSGKLQIRDNEIDDDNVHGARRQHPTRR